MESGLSLEVETCLQMYSSRKRSISGLDQNAIWESLTNLDGLLIFNSKIILVSSLLFLFLHWKVDLIIMLPFCTSPGLIFYE